MARALSLIGRDMAVDLGTANTLVYVRGRGIVLNEPSVVAVNTNTQGIVAVGTSAKRMIGRTPEQHRRHPAAQGRRDRRLRHHRADAALLHPAGAPPAPLRPAPHRDLRARRASPPSSGGPSRTRPTRPARAACYIIDEPMAAALGAGLPVHEPTGNMIVDIGGGTTEVAVISLGGIVAGQSVRTAGDELDQAIIEYVKKEYSLMLGERTAEEIKMAIGSAFPLDDEPSAELRGRDLISGLPKTIVMGAAEIRKAMEEPLNDIVDAVKATLDRCPPELAADVMDRGIVITGGGALLRGLDDRLRAETGMAVSIAENPLSSVALGSGRCIEEFETLAAGAEPGAAMMPAIDCCQPQIT